MTRVIFSAYLSVTPTFAFAVDVVRAEQSVSTAGPSAERSPELPATRKIRVIDITTASAASSDQSRWHDRVAKPSVAKNPASASVERRPVKTQKPKAYAMRRSTAPATDGRSAFASAPTEHVWFGQFYRR